MVAFERFDEVGERGVEVPIFGMQHAGLHIESGLEERGCVDGCGGCSSGC